MRVYPGVYLLLGFLPVLTKADSPEGLEFFEKRIRPVLVEHCYKCHSAEMRNPKGGLRLDTRQGLRKGGESGPGVVPGKPEASLLLRAIRFRDDNLKMPPKGKLPDAVVMDLETWIRMGTPDPRDAPAVVKAKSWEEVLRERRSWWSLQPVKRPTIPPIIHHPSSIIHPIDLFIISRLEKEGLNPSPEADRLTLIRRLFLVLTGLPPTPEEVESARNDKQEDWYERLVERLLASPHFGERWARHWLDVVRFGETHGNEWNYEVHHAWRYRDYVIRAFNEDVPYNQFVREHLAGDLLPNPRRNREGRFNESVIGTAFYRFGEVNHDDCIGLKQIGYDLLDNQIDTLSKAFQATTIACARCHDHKIDAISTKDYHALLGVLRGSRLVSHAIDGTEVNAEAIARLRQLKGDIRKELASLWLREAGEIDAARLDRLAMSLKEKSSMEDILAPWRSPTEWSKLGEQYEKEERERGQFNASRFVPFTDWKAGGQGLRDGASASGEMILSIEGDSLIKTILPAGTYTHALSDRFNGTLRSNVLPRGTKRISFEVMGQRSSAVRLVSNNCQLNYKNYRALTNDRFQWVTFEPPPDSDVLRTYAELMTMLDNPKFPDQLSALGGDGQNYRLPWEKAAANPRSFFGVRRVLLHDSPELPKPEVSHLRRLFVGPAIATREEITIRYRDVIKASLRAWQNGSATDEDVRWLDGLLSRGLLSNTVRATKQLETLAKEYRAVEATLSIPRVVPGLADHGPGIEQPVFTRGDCNRPGDLAPRRYLEVLSKPGEQFAPSGSGRLELAERIASADNPLTARVMVNRVWHHLFGAGVVRTVDDFGHVGELPSHPQLLDWLAGRFVEDNWSTKQLIRSIVLTRTFRAVSKPSDEAKQRDPLNRLLSHFPARRLEAEAIRDSILAASGRLDRTLYGMSVQPYREKENADRRLFPGPLDGDGRRSVYIKNNLMEGPKFLGAFNLPGGKVAQGKRDVTNVPAQALALLNDPFVLQQAAVWSERLLTRPETSVADRIEYLFRVALSRSPTEVEKDRFSQTVVELARLHNVTTENLMKSRAVWRELAHAMFNIKEFIYLR